MGDWDCEFDMSHTLTTHFFLGDFHAATVTNDAFVADAFVFAAMAFPVAGRSENLLAEESVAFGLICSIVDSLRLGNFTIGASFDRLG